ncbi:MAG TPA: hypothetical protein DIT64_07540 [Verrucomicrobiales bacterium]|nr:hypothetical protein [Verrucomicrobiales bacterium]HCN77782.1 hypothetical protein [Verrucomicrobiales bacterium]HRK13312.1 sialidase family protein [Prosthecobacter sp.]
MNTRASLRLLCLCSAAALSAPAQSALDVLFDPLLPMPNRQPGQPERPGRQQRGPWENDVLVHQLGKDGGAPQVAVFERAGVPTLTRLRDGRLLAAHQHFPKNDPGNFDKIAVHFSSDEGLSWTPARVMQVEGLPEGMRFPFDPTLVTLPDGRVRLYFTGMTGRVFSENRPRIHSAISEDGVNYRYEEGARFEIENRPVIDCAVVLHQGVFHLYAPDNGGRPENGGEERPRQGAGFHATSTDGLNFTRAEDVSLPGRLRWLGNAQSNGATITFFGTSDGGGDPRADGGSPRGGIFMAVSSDGQEWRLIESPGVSGADPGAAATPDGGWIIAVTGPPVEGRSRPSAQPPGQNPAPDDAWLRRWALEVLLDEALKK